MVGESPHAHEQEALQFAIEQLPSTEPYTLWGLIELVEPTTGRMYEIDMLVLGYSALYLVEIKSGPGKYEGDQVDWYRTAPEQPSRWMDPPLRLANLKAKILKGRLRSKMRHPDRAPRVEPLIFLSHPETDVRLSTEGRLGVVTRKDLVRAIVRHEFPGSPPGWRGERVDSPLAKDVTQGLDALGLRKRKGKLFAGSYELGALLDDGFMQLDGGVDGPVAPSGYQDRLATHRETPGVSSRARVYLVPQQTSVERRQLLRRAADREVQLLHSVREHPNVLRFVDYITDAPLGPTVLFDAFEGGVPLDAFLRQNPELSFQDRVTILEQVAQALAYCHKKEVRHGALGPHAVLVRRDPEGTSLQTRLFNFQLGAGKQVRATVHWSALSSDPWALYQAPELREEGGAPSPESDIFSLGALAYLIFTGRQPADSVADLDARMQRDHFLDPGVATDETPAPIVEAIKLATDRVVARRADDAAQWIDLLIGELTRPDAEPSAPALDPLEARKNDILGGDLMVQAILGYGATSRVLQVERSSDHRSYALKVSLSPEHDDRLVEEAKVLAKLEHPRIVRVVEQRTMADRTCLLLTLAGEHTLQRFLAREGSVSLDYAGRFGEDLLSALEELESKGVIHRDIKPANVGVGTPGKTATHLTLFDFSLGLAPLTELGVGTAVYRDPFLRARGQWDPPADRWSAAITLHELLTGVRPALEHPPESGGTTPKITLAAERFDPAVRERLVGFFDKALSPDVELRFGSAREMQRAWTLAFEAPAAIASKSSTPPEGIVPVVRSSTEPPPPEGDTGPITSELLAAIRPETPVDALPLSARAKNALDRAGVVVAADLLALPDNRLSSVRGVGRLVAQEILSLRDRWKSAFALAPVPVTPFFPAGYAGDDVLLSTTKLDSALVAALADGGIQSLAALASAPVAHVTAMAHKRGFDLAPLTALLQREARAMGDREHPPTLEAWVEALLPSAKKRTAHLRSLYGLTAPFLGRVGLTVREIAEHHHLTTAAIYVALGRARETWAKHGALGDLRELLHSVLEDAGGAMPLERAAEALRSRLPHDKSAPEPALLAASAALFRIVAEVERDQPAGLRIARLGAPGLWTLLREDDVKVLARLGEVADELAGRAVLASTGEAARRFAEIVQDTPLGALPVDRVAELAAAASTVAARSTRLEIYPRGLAPERALELSATVLTSNLTAEDVHKRVGARYPEAAPLPPRPALDALLVPHGLIWNPVNGQYQRKGQDHATSLPSTSFSPLQRLPTASRGEAVAKSPETIVAQAFEDKLSHALERRLLRVVGVRADRAREAALALAARAGTEAISFDAELIGAMHRLMKENGVDPDVVQSADAEGPVGAAWPHLIALAEDAAGQVAAKLLPNDKPLILVQPGLIARYRLAGFLQSLIDASKRPESAAIFLLVPAHDGGGLPLINEELPIHGVLPTDALWVSPHWIENKHNAAA